MSRLLKLYMYNRMIYKDVGFMQETFECLRNKRQSLLLKLSTCVRNTEKSPINLPLKLTWSNDIESENIIINPMRNAAAENEEMTDQIENQLKVRERNPN